MPRAETSNETATTEHCESVDRRSAAPAFAQAPDGAAVYQKTCATCHANPARRLARAQPRDAAAVLAGVDSHGADDRQHVPPGLSDLSDAEKRAVAEFLAGRAFGTPPPHLERRPLHVAAPPMTDPGKGANWNGWGGTVTNTRFVPADKGGLTAPLVPKLKLKWAFGFPGVTSARAQPTVVGGRLFVAQRERRRLRARREDRLHLLDVPRAGGRPHAPCRSAPYKGAGGTAAYASTSATARRNAYAVDADTGKQIWTRKVDEHPVAPRHRRRRRIYNGRVYVPVAGISEEAAGRRARYECCTFRGSVTALDANTGAVVWKTYTIAEEPKPRGVTKDGVQTWGPAGGGIWSAPTIDARRRVLYVATGNGYADPPQPTTDAVSRSTSRPARSTGSAQPTPDDVWMLGCQAENPDNPNCPATAGPDLRLLRVADAGEAHERVATSWSCQQKSGMAYALDPDKEGALVWQYRIGEGSGLGGQWGGAVDGQQRILRRQRTLRSRRPAACAP